MERNIYIYSGRKVKVEIYQNYSGEWYAMDFDTGEIYANENSRRVLGLRLIDEGFEFLVAVD